MNIRMAAFQKDIGLLKIIIQDILLSVKFVGNGDGQNQHLVSGVTKKGKENDYWRLVLSFSYC